MMHAIRRRRVLPNRSAAFIVHSARFVAAAGILTAAAYLLSWRLLWVGLTGSDMPYHLDLTAWVAQSFPQIHWWYPWDASGTAFREGYPLTVHWLTVGLARVAGLGLSDAMQLIQFAVTPLCALGIYGFCALRLRRPLAGLVAGLLYLLSPITWTFLTDWGFYANQAGTVLFMPVLIALDIFHSRWAIGDRSWRFRLSGLLVMTLIALLGMVSPGIVAAPLLAIPAYGLAAQKPDRRTYARWLLLATPLLGAGALLLSAFWALPLAGYLGVIGSRQPAPVYASNLFHLWGLDQVLQLHPMRPAIIQDRTSISPAVWLPALGGLMAALWKARLRPFVLLIGFGLISMTWEPLYAVTFGLPFFPYLVTFRSGMLFLQFLLPVLAGVGLVVVLPELAGRAIGRLRLPSGVRGSTELAATLAGLAVGVALVAAFALRVAGYPSRIAYGAFESDVRDLWSHHRDDVCALSSASGSSPCGSTTLAGAFSIAEVTDACRDVKGALRDEIPLCAAFADTRIPQWQASDDRLVATTLAWCQDRQDPICAARYASLAAQILEPAQWRPPVTGCRLDPVGCREQTAAEQQVRTAFPQTPQRAVLNAQVPDLFKRFHDLTGGGQVSSYNTQLVSSPELSAYLIDALLNRPGVLDKAELVARSGADAVVLGPSQASLAPEYDALGWRRVSSSPIAYVDPKPTGPASEWPSGCTALVVGAAPGTPSHPYNDLFEYATAGMIAADDAWLVRGRSAYVDDYTLADLQEHPVLILVGYRYHDRAAAWDRLNQYVEAGGRLFVETGWQYVDPDWNGGVSPAVLPIGDLRWAPVDAQAPVLVNGADDSGWGPMTYQGGGWGASASQSLRPGAESLVSEGGKVLVARWRLGKGRVLWSGMNLIAHAFGKGGPDEKQFLHDQWQWLLPRVGGIERPAQIAVQPQWQGDEARLYLSATAGPTAVLFRESTAPGWSAELVSPGGTQAVRIQPAEMDYMLVQLSSVPAGAQLVFRYGPTWSDRFAALLSLLTLIGAGAWLVRPGGVGRLQAGLRRLIVRPVRTFGRGWRSEEDDD